MAHPRIGLIVTGADTAQDFQHFLKTLEQWHPNAELFVYTDDATDKLIKTARLDDATDKLIKTARFKGIIHRRRALNAYTGLNRAQMEKTKGNRYANLWTDFMYEKAAVLEWMFEIQDTTPAWFLDADISHLAPLPTISATATVALSPHAIRPQDEAKYGKYNGGFLWFKDASLLPVWREAGHTSRFFEQSALEDVAKAAGETLYEFPPQVNFGWWRMFQAPCTRQEIQSRFSIFRNDKSVGIRYDGQPLQSIHTHWFSTTAFECVSFRMWFDEFTKKFKAHKPIDQYRKLIGLV